nr:MAG TPA: hypothetical protein [Caudoviricetes sp.]
MPFYFTLRTSFVLPFLIFIYIIVHILYVVNTFGKDI